MNRFPGGFVPRPCSRFQWALLNLYLGLVFGYPVCCVIEYAIRDVFGQKPAEAAGCWKNSDCPQDGYVHCWWHRRIRHKTKASANSLLEGRVA